MKKMTSIFGPSFWAAIIFFAMIGFATLLILYALKYRRTHKPPQYEDFNTMRVSNLVCGKQTQLRVSVTHHDLKLYNLGIYKVSFRLIVTMQLFEVGFFKVSFTLRLYLNFIVDIPRSATHVAMLKTIYPKGVRQRNFLPNLPGNI